MTTDEAVTEPIGGPTARRMVLGGQLRRLREAAGISREDAGYSIRASASKISRLELGRVSFKHRDVTDLLSLYGVSDATERDAFLVMAGESNQPGWWHPYGDVLPPWFADYVGLEESASRLQTYEIYFVPGLLQTARYASAVIRQGLPESSAEEVDRRISLRLRRQQMFAKRENTRLWAVIDESILHRPIGGRDVLREQLRHLLEITALPNVSLQVVPFALGGSAAEGAFTILRFAESDLPDIVYLEHLCGAMYLDKTDEVEQYTKVANRLAVDARTPEDTRKFVADQLKRL
ncbi:MAG TPA: helix-turn-helix transcriptional regulator [Pseudonocardiaceae bacterium]|nr:helix-turn-helix transcriptional regulator [Pseudonocardiaceae bacterium]